MTASVNRLPVAAEVWERMEKTTLSENSSSQPDFIPLGSSMDRTNDYSTNEQDQVNGYQQLDYANSQVKRKRLISGDITTTCTPWRTKEYTCDPPGLHEEICDFYEYMKPRPSEVQMRSDVILRTMSIILSRWPQAKVQVFGSFCTTLFLPTGDIDLVVHGEWPSTPLFSLEEDLRRHNVAIDGSIMVIDKTTVPIIKFIDKLTEVRVDISFNQESGSKSALLIQKYIEEYPFLPKLVFVLKQFLYERNLHEVYIGGISSYSLILLLVSFLQRHARQSAAEANPNLGVLLIEFFELYGRNFNYMKTGITVVEGGSYFSKEEKVGSSTAKNSLLYVVDPSNEPENAAGGCFGLWQVKQAFDQAFCMLHSAVLSRENPVPKRDSLLSSIISVSKEVDDYRKWVDNHWQVPPPQYYYPMVPPMISHPPTGAPTPFMPSQFMQQQGFTPPSAPAEHVKFIVTNNLNPSAALPTPTEKSPLKSNKSSRGKAS